MNNKLGEIILTPSQIRRLERIKAIAGLESDLKELLAAAVAIIAWEDSERDSTLYEAAFSKLRAAVNNVHKNRLRGY
jgi:siroheme synthase (precorrin-2 oxidase/ferrochelatase)